MMRWRSAGPSSRHRTPNPAETAPTADSCDAGPARKLSARVLVSSCRSCALAASCGWQASVVTTGGRRRAEGRSGGSGWPCAPFCSLVPSIDGPTHLTGQGDLFQLAAPGTQPNAAKSETVMNRRTFLASLLAATASALLPVPFAKAVSYTHLTLPTSDLV